MSNAQYDLDAARSVLLANHTRDEDGFVQWHQEVFGTAVFVDGFTTVVTNSTALTGSEGSKAVAVQVATSSFPDYEEEYLDFCKGSNQTLWAENTFTIFAETSGFAVFGLPTIAKLAEYSVVPVGGGYSMVFTGEPILGAENWQRIVGTFLEEGTHTISTLESGYKLPLVTDPDPKEPPRGIRCNGDLLDDLWTLESQSTKAKMTDAKYVAALAGELDVICYTRNHVTTTGGTYWDAGLVVLNRNRTGTNSAGSQPTCHGYGEPEERTVAALSMEQNAEWTAKWITEMGITEESGGGLTFCTDYILRAGEQVGFFLQKKGAGSLGAGASVCILNNTTTNGYAKEFGKVAEESIVHAEWDEIAKVSVNGFWARQYYAMDQGDGSYPAIVLPRDCGDFNRDFEGPDQARGKTHNQEYDWVMGLYRCASRFSNSDITTAQKALNLAEMCGWHSANIDIYQYEDGPIRFMYGGPFSHPNHGASGPPHRGQLSFSGGHWMARGLRYAELMSGGHPLLSHAAELFGRRTRIKALNGEGAPYYSNVTGELRGIGYYCNVLRDEFYFLAGEDSADALTGLNKACQELIDAKPWFIDGGGDHKYKPWMACLGAAGAKQAAADTGSAVAQELHDMLISGIWNHGISLGDNTLYYERGWGQYDHKTRTDDMQGGFWNCLAGDLLYDTSIAVAESLFTAAITSAGWYIGASNGDWSSVQVNSCMMNYGLEMLTDRG